jgi:hypothetical protein
MKGTVSFNLKNTEKAILVPNKDPMTPTTRPFDKLIRPDKKWIVLGKKADMSYGRLHPDKEMEDLIEEAEKSKTAPKKINPMLMRGGMSMNSKSRGFGGGAIASALEKFQNKHKHPTDGKIELDKKSPQSIVPPISSLQP